MISSLINMLKKFFLKKEYKNIKFIPINANERAKDYSEISKAKKY